MTADDIRAALRTKYHDSRQYAIAEEVGLTTGFSHRRLDMMALDCYNSNGFRIDGFEIKVSTSDLRRELEDPEKHVAFFDVIDARDCQDRPGCVDNIRSRRGSHNGGGLNSGNQEVGKMKQINFGRRNNKC